MMLNILSLTAIAIASSTRSCCHINNILIMQKGLTSVHCPVPSLYLYTCIVCDKCKCAFGYSWLEIDVFIVVLQLCGKVYKCIGIHITINRFINYCWRQPLLIDYVTINTLRTMSGLDPAVFTINFDCSQHSVYNYRAIIMNSLSLRFFSPSYSVTLSLSLSLSPPLFCKLDIPTGFSLRQFIFTPPVLSQNEPHLFKCVKQ